jgi:hypothetical protein
METYCFAGMACENMGMESPGTRRFPQESLS